MTEHAPTTRIQLTYQGHDISPDVAPGLLAFRYQDFASGQIDSLELSLADPDGRWRGTWAPQTGDTLTAAIITRDAGGREQRLACGTFAVDSTGYTLPATVSVKALAASVNRAVSRTRRTRAWQSVTLKAVAEKVAAECRATVQFVGADTPPLERVEQKDETDLAFLHRLCQQEGYGIKVDSQRIVLYHRRTLDSSPAVLTLSPATLAAGAFEADATVAYARCAVKYRHPDKGLLKAVYTLPGAPADGQTLQVTKHAASQAEALRQAESYLREANRRQVTARLTVRGDVRLAAGLVIAVEGSGVYDGRYAVDECQHSVSGSGGYVTELTCARVGTV